MAAASLPNVEALRELRIKLLRLHKFLDTERVTYEQVRRHKTISE